MDLRDYLVQIFSNCKERHLGTFQKRVRNGKSSLSGQQTPGPPHPLSSNTAFIISIVSPFQERNYMNNKFWRFGEVKLMSKMINKPRLPTEYFILVYKQSRTKLG